MVSLAQDWQEVDERCHYCHSWQDQNERMISAMNAIALIVFAAVWALAILGGLGVDGLGKDSRQLSERGHAEDRPWRSLLSRDA